MCVDYTSTTGVITEVSKITIQFERFYEREIFIRDFVIYACVSPGEWVEVVKRSIGKIWNGNNVSTLLRGSLIAFSPLHNVNFVSVWKRENRIALKFRTAEIVKLMSHVQLWIYRWYVGIWSRPHFAYVQKESYCYFDSQLNSLEFCRSGNILGAISPYFHWAKSNREISDILASLGSVA